MLRFLIKFLLLAIIAAVSIMLVAQWQLDETLKEYTRRLEPMVDVRYESAEISYTGEITLNSLVAYVAVADISLEIGKARLSVGSLFDLAMFKTNLDNKKIPDKGYLIIEDLLLPFNNNLVRSLEKFDSSSASDVVSWAYCGNINKSGLASLEAMGYDYVAADSSLFFMMDKYSGSLVLNGQSTVEDAFQLEYQINIGSVLAWLETQKDRDVGQAVAEDVEPDISLLEIRRIDNGFNERKARMCAQKEGVSVEEYYSGHVEKVKKLLDEVGIKPSDSFSELYSELIKPKSELYWFMQPKANFNFEGITYYSYEEFVKLGGLRILINKKPFDLFSEGWSFDSFQQILVNAQERQKEKEAPKELYKTIFVEREFRPFPSTQASRFIGLKAKVYRTDGTEFEGKISKADDQRVWLVSRSMQGELTLPFTHREIQKFEVFVQVNKEE